MNRRSFLRLAGAAAAGIAIGQTLPPGPKAISVDMGKEWITGTPDGWMPVTITFGGGKSPIKGFCKITKFESGFRQTFDRLDVDPPAKLCTTKMEESLGSETA